MVEQFRILDEELTRLPDRLRGPVVVCLLQGRTQEQAVAELGGSVRTVRRRLEEAKRLLRLRLERRGVVPAVAAGLAAGIGEATAAVPAELPGRTVATAFDFLAGGAAVSAPAAVIAKGVAMGTLARKVKLAMVSVAIGLTALGVGAAGDGAEKADGAKKPAPAVLDKSGPSEPRPLAAPGHVSLQDGWPIDVPGVTHNLGGITVTARSEAVARAIAHEVDYLHREFSSRWLGADPQRGGLRLTVKFAPVGLPGGAYWLTATTGPNNSHAVIDGQPVGGLEEVLETALRPGVMGAIVYERAGADVPVCLRFGVAAQVAAPDKQALADRTCRAFLNRGQGIPLSYLFAVRDIEKSKLRNGDVTGAFAQAYSVVRYLVSLKGERAFVRFLEVSTKRGWPAAAKEVYDIDSIDQLQAAWIDWLNTDRSRAGLPAPVGDLPSELDEEFLPRIPPVKLPGGR